MDCPDHITGESERKHGLAVYKANRMRSRRHHRMVQCSAFTQWVVEQVRTKKWSLDVCVGQLRAISFRCSLASAAQTKPQRGSCS
jgi:hypothetical protein